MRAPGDRGALCLVLHSHMPYVEGFGTWPFGEEWLWEAVATVYLPLLRIVRGANLTIGITPVLADQLERLPGDPGDRFRDFMLDVRAQVHAEDAVGAERTGRSDLAREIRRAAGDYERALKQFEKLGGDLLGAFRELARSGPTELWAGPATHPVLPLLATSVGMHLQLASGMASHLRRFGAHARGLWLPECAYEPGLERDLADHGAQVFCVDQTDALGLGSYEQLEPVDTGTGAVAVPIDWATVARVWDERSGYPTAGPYRNSHQRTTYDLKPWRNDGACYDPDAALALADEHARDFVEHAIERLDAYATDRGRPGILCCALDSELLGHWWYEGPRWLESVIATAAERGLELATLPQALEGCEPLERELAAGSWGHPKDLSTWDSPAVADLAFAARSSELRLVAAAPSIAGLRRGDRERARAALERAARELLAAQSSDWAFLVSRGTAADYPSRRAEGHVDALGRALDALRDSQLEAPVAELAGLAPDLDLSPLIVP